MTILEHPLLPRPFVSISPIGLPEAVSGFPPHASPKNGVSTSSYVAPESPVNPTSPNHPMQWARDEAQRCG